MKKSRATYCEMNKFSQNVHQDLENHNAICYSGPQNTRDLGGPAPPFPGGTKELTLAGKLPPFWNGGDTPADHFGIAFENILLLAYAFPLVQGKLTAGKTITATRQCSGSGPRPSCWVADPGIQLGLRVWRSHHGGLNEHCPTAGYDFTIEQHMLNDGSPNWPHQATAHSRTAIQRPSPPRN